MKSGFWTFENRFSRLCLQRQGKNLLLNDSRRLVFGTLFVFVLGLQYLLLEPPIEEFIIPASWQRILDAGSLAGGTSWLWFRVRASRSASLDTGKNKR
jgi:hypothetical protein